MTGSVGWDLGKGSELSSSEVDFRVSPKPGQLPCGGCHTWFGVDGKVSIERWYLSPYIEKPFNSKVIKCFVPELRSRKCFCVSGFLCNIWTFMNIICTFHIFMDGSVTIRNILKANNTYTNDKKPLLSLTIETATETATAQKRAQLVYVTGGRVHP